MEDWYTRNSYYLEKHGIRSIGHACTTTLNGKHKDKYEASRQIVDGRVNRRTRMVYFVH